MEFINSIIRILEMKWPQFLPALDPAIISFGFISELVTQENKLRRDEERPPLWLSPRGKDIW